MLNLTHTQISVTILFYVLISGTCYMYFYLTTHKELLLFLRISNGPEDKMHWTLVHLICLALFISCVVADSDGFCSVPDKYCKHGICTVRDSPERSVLVWEGWLTVTWDNETSKVHLLCSSDPGKYSPIVSGTERTQVWSLLCVLVFSFDHILTAWPFYNRS